MTGNDDVWLAGVDGCRGGWIAALLHPAGDEVKMRLMPSVVTLLDADERRR